MSQGGAAGTGHRASKDGALQALGNTLVVCTCRLAGQLELKRHALGLLKERVASSESAQLAEAIAASEAEAAEAEAAAKAARERKAAMAASAKACAVLCIWHAKLEFLLLPAVHTHVGAMHMTMLQSALAVRRCMPSRHCSSTSLGMDACAGSASSQTLLRWPRNTCV